MPPRQSPGSQRHPRRGSQDPDTIVTRPVRRPPELAEESRPDRRPQGPPERPERGSGQRPPERPGQQGGSDEPPPREPPSSPPYGGSGGRGRAAVRTFGEVMITLGLVLLLFVVYELYITNLFSAAKQNDASAALERRWTQPQRQLHADPIEGKAFARIYIPSFGADYDFTIQEGVGAKSLEVGPGHYIGTALPGNPGNFAVAGHRVGKGAPFNDLDLLESCDAIVIETRSDFFVYRVLPMQGEVAGWSAGKGRNADCAQVSTLRDPNMPNGGPYGATYGRKIVNPGRGDAVAAVPYRPNSQLPKSDQVALLTLTTCHPQFSDAQRMIIHGVLVKQFRKGPDSGGYPQVLKEIGAS